MGFLGCGGWIYYYYFLLGSSITKALKDDIFGFGKTFPIFNELIISRHKFMILFLNYFSEFLFGLIISLYLYYTEKSRIKRKNEYEKLENNNNSNNNNDILSKNKEKNKDKDKDKESKKAIRKKSIKQEMQIFSKNSKNIDSDANKSKESDIFQNEINRTLLEEDNFSNLTTLEKKNEKKFNPNLNDDNLTIPKKYELIHNDLYEDITESSYQTIFLSSFLLIVYDVIMKWIFSSNEIFDYFFFNIIIMTLIFKFHYKEKIYSHQRVGLIIILFIAGSLFVACLFEDVDFTSENKTIWDAFNENHYMIFLFIIIYLGSSVCYGYGTIIQKLIMDNKFVYPYKIIFCKGVIGMIISAILIVISTLVPCKQNKIIDINTSNFLNFNQNNLENSTNNNSSTPLFECVDNYNNKIYFDNFLSYFVELNGNKNITNNNKSKSSKYLEIFLYIPVYSILHFLTSVLLIFVNKLLSPIHCLIVDSLYRIIHIFILTLQNNEIQKDTEGFFYELMSQPFSTRILRVISYFVSILGYCIYLEIIELKFCGLNDNIRKNIKLRAELDGNTRENISNASDSTYSSTGEDSEESGNIKNNGK